MSEQQPTETQPETPKKINTASAVTLMIAAAFAVSGAMIWFLAGFRFLLWGCS